ncbi:hypothetical protein PWT90_10963 [Aphanocladium album]|nr:hypothetical protein PWT90_10963 [Aphanocladium album]
MQITTAAILMAAAAAAVPSGPSPTGSAWGTRYTDHQCKTLHSLPNRDFGMFDCLEMNTVGDHQCKGSEREAPTPHEYNRCVDTSKGAWKGAVSFRCPMGHT